MNTYFCKVCKNGRLEWIRVRNAWDLYDFKTGKLHSAFCTERPQPEDKKNTSMVCKHGILLDRLCPVCDAERNRE